jgi:phage terminase small subunit
MAGHKGRQGRKPKMTAKHVLEGTFRAERHAGRVDSVAAASPANLPKPNVIGEAGKWLWELTIRNLPGGVLRDQDAAKLELMCVSWEQYRKLLERMQIDDDPKLISKLKNLADMIDKFGKQFGMSPLDRASLKVEDPKEPMDPFAEFMKAGIG